MLLAAMALLPAALAAQEPGVSRALAEARARLLSDVRYELSFSLPASPSEPVTGAATIRFKLADASETLVLDFRKPEGTEVAVRSGGNGLMVRAVADHLLIPASALQPGDNALELRFTAGSAPLNRNPGFLYTLLVPARAHEVFPCFDQPDLKARFSLSLDTPASWTAVANGAAASRVESGGRARWRFAPTEPIPTYLFAFAAGEFKTEDAERGGRRFRMLHRETDAAKLERNREAIFDLSARSLRWLEEYTGIPYPWGKFDFVLIPSFQYSGMEHPGAVLYDAGKLLLEESASQEQLLERASLIAHETAHMWFGDLVTMRWFDDVWLKEVFANAMAAKAVGPSFPEVRQDVRFLVEHFPRAYRVDRTPGANPILQPLDNLARAGSLYGDVIYRKAPIAMRQLELLMGEQAFRDGLREYLGEFRFGNATWSQLIAILGRKAGRGLEDWSRAWISEPGRPRLAASLDADGGVLRGASVSQTDPRGRGLLWEQRLEPAFYYAGERKTFSVSLASAAAPLGGAAGIPAPDWVLPDRSGLAYGLLELDDASRAGLLSGVSRLEDSLDRAVAWLALWDSVLERRTGPAEFLDAAAGALEKEPEELVVQQLLNCVATAYWRFLPAWRRADLAPRLEDALWKTLLTAHSTSLKGAVFKTYRAVALTETGVAKLERLWRNELRVPGLTLSEEERTNLALELAVRDAPSAARLLEAQSDAITNADRKARFQFLRRAASPDPREREALLASLSDASNRRRESWVADALKWLHHPLRAPGTAAHLRPALDLLEEVRRTGDIFFPRAWIRWTLEGHSSPAAAAAVRAYLEENPGLAPELRALVLQVADELFLAADLSR